MIRVTIYNEYVQERQEGGELIRQIHGGVGIHDTLMKLMAEDEKIEVKHVVFLENIEEKLTDEVLDDTDVLLWWGHVAHGDVPDEVAFRVVRHVQMGMGFVALHSAHASKPLKYLLGTSCSLKWREGDYCRVWNTCPAHPIMQGVPEHIELPEEEMYGEFFDIPNPDATVCISWFAGGEVFRSGCTWTRGYGRIFYLQPGHETNKSYFNSDIRRIIRNSVHWCAGTGLRRPDLSCPHAEPLS